MSWKKESSKNHLVGYASVGAKTPRTCACFLFFIALCCLAVQRGGCVGAVRVGNDPDGHRLRGFLEAIHQRQQGMYVDYTRHMIRMYYSIYHSVRKCKQRLAINVSTQMIIIFACTVVRSSQEGPTYRVHTTLSENTKTFLCITCMY